MTTGLIHFPPPPTFPFPFPVPLSSWHRAAAVLVFDGNHGTRHGVGMGGTVCCSHRPESLGWGVARGPGATVKKIGCRTPGAVLRREGGCLTYNAAILA
jgi:hypothetical protein